MSFSGDVYFRLMPGIGAFFRACRENSDDRYVDRCGNSNDTFFVWRIRQSLSGERVGAHSWANVRLSFLFSK